MTGRVVLTTGGTGGHIFPALAVAEELKSRSERTEILFVGGASGPEARLAQEAGLAFAGLPAKGVLGRGLASLAAPAWIARSLVRCLSLYRSFKPQAVIGFGGFASFVPVLAGRLLSIPTLVHEQNSIPGVANRLLARLADRILVSFPDEAGFFPAAKTRWTGNPVRASIVALGQGGARDASAMGKNLLVLGGSQGARGVNEAVMAMAQGLYAAGVSLMHHTGPRDAERVRAAYEAQGLPFQVREFIEDMAGAYAWADLVVCRAGATTVAEVAVAGKPCLFIPFPHATHSHQTLNAQYLARLGAALMIEERDLPETDLLGLITGLLGDPSRLGRMAAETSKLGNPGAARDVVSNMLQVLEKMGRHEANHDVKALPRIL